RGAAEAPAVAARRGQRRAGRGGGLPAPPAVRHPVQRGVRHRVHRRVPPGRGRGRLPLAGSYLGALPGAARSAQYGGPARRALIIRGMTSPTPGAGFWPSSEGSRTEQSILVVRPDSVGDVLLAGPTV